MSRVPYVVVFAGLLSSLTASEMLFGDEPRKVVLIAGPKSHGPVGNGMHDYPWSVKLLKVMLDNSNVREQLRVEYHLDGFPKDITTLDDADTIMVISDGRDGDKFEEAPHFNSEVNLKAVQKQIDRGCGFLTFHFSTFAPDEYAKQICEWSGGYFDWETDGERKWFSAIKTQETDVLPASPDHVVMRGVNQFRMREEFYYNIRFALEGEEIRGLAPLWKVPTLEGREPDGGVVAWAKQRADGGRGFGTTCGHFYDNWRHADFRKLILNAIAWTAKVEVPLDGVASRYFTHAEITKALAGVEGTASAVIGDGPIRALLITGNEAHKWHNWEKSTPLVEDALEKDSRIAVDVQLGFEGLTQRDMSQYDLIVQNNYANWQDPKQLSDDAKTSFMNFLQNGGGLILIHFADGAFNFSLPNAGESDWPEYRRIARRVWNHHGKGEAKSGHDAYGKFMVNVSDVEHAVTAGLSDFEVIDELYFRQDGSEPVVPLLTGHSKVTDRDEPLAFEYRYGKGRVFQTLLGHSEKTWQVFESREFLRRAAAFVSGRKIVPLSAEDDPIAAPPETAKTEVPSGPALLDGKFGKALNGRVGGLFVDAKAEHRDAAVTVECWTRMDRKTGFNILIASEPKASKTHWEMYSYAGSGVFSVYIPARGGEYRSDVDICDGKWHHVGMTLEKSHIRMFVDGRKVVDRPLKGDWSESTGGAIAIGRLVEGGVGCSGEIDEVRIRRGVHVPTSVPDEPLDVDADTVGLWRFDELEGDRAVRDESAAKVDATRSAPASAVTAEKKKNVTIGAAIKSASIGRKTIRKTIDGSRLRLVRG